MNAPAGLFGPRWGRIILIAAVCSLAAAHAAAESLWEPGFNGYVTDSSRVSVGDLVRVRIDAHNSFSLNTVHSDSQDLRFSFQGGEGASLFSFLPQGSSESAHEVEEEGEYSLATGLVAEVVEQLDNGRFLLRGSRSVEINGKREELVVEGEFSPSALTRGELGFSRLADARLTYTAIGMGEETDITAEDLVPARDSREVPDGQETAVQESPEAAGDEGRENGGYSLSAAKRQELLRRYINRIIDILFQR